MDASALLSRLVSRLKGRSYEIDPRIDARYLGVVTLERAMMKLRGFYRFPLPRK